MWRILYLGKKAFEGAVLSDITNPHEKVGVLPFFLESNAIDYYHSPTKSIQDDWDQLMKVLAQLFNCISHEPVYFAENVNVERELLRSTR